ncbi:undecaprenyldiphospho-muramoylpentapeptide beta-N-acetylglucosaminyltransferase [Patescibacteria group bacterium]|nr:undecaprenyldiphospho-muramoylpentapeptide beta-N-acetylglucosaminyltransferase [Patescibacteria group bacterium]
MKIILTGGGTIGAVSPLLSIKEKIEEQYSGSEFIWIGTKAGIEREIITKENIPYYSISAGKLRRYFSWRNFIEPFSLIAGFFQSLRIVRKFDPDLILSVGGFVSVPVVIAGWLQKKKSIIHQQDIKAGLANKIMAFFAAKITVTFSSSLKDFPKKKTVQTGNPARKEIFSGSMDHAISRFHLEKNLPTLLVMGGSLGSLPINRLISESIEQLVEFCQVIQVTGKRDFKKINLKNKSSRYRAFDYLHEELADAYAIADLVVSRAGLSTLTELSALAKPAIIIPIPHHQQEENAKYFSGKKAVVLFEQETLNKERFVSLVKKILADSGKLKQLSENIKGIMPSSAAERFIAVIKQVV